MGATRPPFHAVRQHRARTRLGGYGLLCIALLCVLWPLKSAAQGPPAPTTTPCDICVIHDPDTADGDMSEIGLMARLACRTAKLLSCDDVDDCWFESLIETIVEVSRGLSVYLPNLLTSGYIVSIVAALLVLTFTVDAAKMAMGDGSLARSALPGRFMRTGIAMILTIALAGTFGADLMQWVGHAAATGAFTGRATAEIIHGAVPGAISLQYDQCNSLQTASAEELLGWPGTKIAIAMTAKQAFELAAVLLGVAWTILPQFSDLIQTYARTTAALATGDFSAIFETLRIVFAITLIGTGMTLALTVCFALLEAILVMGLCVGLAPVWAWLWIWEGTRKAAHQAFSGVLYGIVSLAFLGITVEIARGAMQAATAYFHENMKNVSDPPNPERDYAFGGPEAAKYRKCVEDAQVQTDGLRREYQSYLCLSHAASHPRPAPQGTLFGWFRTVDVHASRLQNDVISWLPQLLVLVGAAVVVTAIMRYGTAAASEITGFRAAQNQIAQQALGATKGLLGGASKRLGAMSMK